MSLVTIFFFQSLWLVLLVSCLATHYELTYYMLTDLQHVTVSAQKLDYNQSLQGSAERHVQMKN